MRKIEYKTEQYDVPLNTLEKHFNKYKLYFPSMTDYGLAIPTKNGKTLIELLNEEGANGWHFISSTWIKRPYKAKLTIDNHDGLLEVFYKKELE